MTRHKCRVGMWRLPQAFLKTAVMEERSWGEREGCGEKKSRERRWSASDLNEDGTLFGGRNSRAMAAVFTGTLPCSAGLLDLSRYTMAELGGGVRSVLK